MDGPGFGSLLQVVGAMLLLIGGLAAILYLLKRYGPKAGFTAFNRGELTLEGQLALGPRRSVAVVNCAGKRLVLGVTEQRISLLTKLDDGDFEAELERSIGETTHG